MKHLFENFLQFFSVRVLLNVLHLIITAIKWNVKPFFFLYLDNEKDFSTLVLLFDQMAVSC